MKQPKEEKTNFQEASDFADEQAIKIAHSHDPQPSGLSWEESFLDGLLQAFLRDSLREGEEQPLIRRAIRNNAIKEISALFLSQKKALLTELGESVAKLLEGQGYAQSWSYEKACSDILELINKMK